MRISLILMKRGSVIKNSVVSKLEKDKISEILKDSKVLKVVIHLEDGSSIVHKKSSIK